MYMNEYTFLVTLVDGTTKTVSVFATNRNDAKKEVRLECSNNGLALKSFDLQRTDIHVS